MKEGEMLAYAESRQRIGERKSSPTTMLMIIGAHVAAIAVAMSVKMVIDNPPKDPPIDIEWVKPLEPPPPNPEPPSEHQPTQSTPYKPPVIVPTPPTTGDILDTTDKVIASNSFDVGKAVIPEPLPLPPIADPVRIGPRLATPESALRPPYPSSKLDSQEEASLRLKLSIDERGRVVAVEPAGPVDRAFFEAARRHLLAKWRYKPATVDGNPVASSTVITLTFQLEG
jgi:protein TonB